MAAKNAAAEEADQHERRNRGRRASDDLLRESEERYRALVEQSPDGITIYVDGIVRFANRAAAHVFGAVSPFELVGRPVDDLVPPEDRAGLREEIERVLSGELLSVPRERRILRRDGLMTPVEITRALLTYQGSPAVQVVIRDISERHDAERALRAARDELRELAARLLTTQEEERRRVARELHDDTAQRLAALAIHAARLERTHPDDRDLAADLRDLRDELVRLSDDVHGISRRLHPSLLDNLGLSEAIASECDAFTHRTGFRVHYEPATPIDPVREDVALCLFRVVQEGIRNAAKHSRAPGAVVRLKIEDGDLLLSVSDEGCGFEANAPRERHSLGLAGMEERVRLSGGALTVESSPGAGATVTARVPRGGWQP